MSRYAFGTGMHPYKIWARRLISMIHHEAKKGSAAAVDSPWSAEAMNPAQIPIFSISSTVTSSAVRS